MFQRTPSSSSFGSQLIVRNPSSTEGPPRERVVSGSSVRELINQFEDLDSSVLQDDSNSVDVHVDDLADRSFDHFPSSPPSQFASPPASPVASGSPLATPNNDIDYYLPSPSEIAEIMSSPVPNLAEKHPRITMTPSMLYAHAHARGSADKETDPVYQALYAGASRDVFKHPVQLPHIEKTTSMEAFRFHKGAQFFYDPLDTVKQAPGSEPLQHREKSGQSYDEFMATFKPTVGRYHSRGSKVYNEFGYLKDNGNWVDPDSMSSMNDSILRSENREDSHQFSNDLPVLPSTHKGPKIMSEEEQNEFYAGYMSEVSDDIDGEGDPRQHRIDPATFARLAQGAVRRNVLAEDEMDSSIFENLRLSPYSPVRKSRHHSPELAYDLRDGSRMSDVRSTISNPSLQSSPRGVNLQVMPGQYPYLHPHAAHNLPLQHYSAHTGNAVDLIHTASSSASDLFTMTEDLAVGALGSGMAFDDAVKNVVHQRAEYKTLEHERAYAKHEQENAKEEKEDLMRDVWFLKREVQEKKDKDEAEKQARKIKKREDRVRRSLAEQKQSLAADIWREAEEGKRIKAENEVLKREVEELRAEKQRMMEEMGRTCDDSDSDTDGGVSCNADKRQ